MFKKMLPVGIGLVLVILITLTVSIVKKANDKTPSFSSADEVYLKVGDYEITNDRLYTYMKKTYGVTELLNMVDEKLYADEIAKVDTASEDFIKYVNKQVFEDEDLSKVEDPQEKWDDIISSLLASELISKEEAKENDYENTASPVWTVVKNYYKLGYARTEWAKKAYLDHYFADRNDGEWFDMTNKENATSSIEAYYDANYKGSTVGFYIPFTSEKAAYETMESVGINTNSNVLSNDGWVKDTYDYNTTLTVTESDFLTYDEVIQAFINMYNKVLSYYNNGADIITASSYQTVLKKEQTANLVKKAIADAIGTKTWENVVNLPTTVKVTGESDATITWSLSDTSFGTLENSVLTAKREEGTSDTTVDNKLTYTVKFNDTEVSGSITIESKVGEETPSTSTIVVEDVEPFKAYEFTSEFLANPGNDFSKFTWTYEEANEINSTLATYLSTDSTKLTISEDPSNLYKSYTLKPVKIGNYYFLIIKLADNKAPELFEKDAEGNIRKDDDGKYIIKDQALFDEIVEKKKQDLLTDNAINQMIYQNRFDHKVKIYDSFIEAMYEYEYTNFFKTTLKLTDYDKYKTTKKNKKEIIVEFLSDKDNKKSKVTISADDLFNRMEKKYAMNVTATLVENYNLISNTEFNNIYNPYTDTVLDKTSYKNLLNSEINTLRKNFESGYFTYSYLSYYGFTPNFPAKYGWSKFIKDYFCSYNDQELLTNSSYGGTIYSDALTKFTDSLYGYQEILAKMQKAYDEWFGVNVVNLMVQIDPNYNANSESSDNASILLEEKDNWTEEQKNLAKELTTLIYDVANQTNEATLYDQLNAVVTLYNEADYTYDATSWTNAKNDNKSIYDFNYWGKFKKAGLFVSVEKAADYDSSSEIYSEFADVCRILWNKAKDLDLLGTTFDAPIICDEAFTTDYGYHRIAALSAKKITDLPSEEEIEIYRAQALIDTVNESIKSTQENIDKYTASGYNVSTYETQLKLYNEKLAKYTEELTTVLTKYGHDKDYTLDADAKERIDAWYTNAEKAIEEGTIITEEYIKQMNSQLVDSKINFTKADNKDRFKSFLDILAEEVKKQNEE